MKSLQQVVLKQADKWDSCVGNCAMFAVYRENNRKKIDFSILLLQQKKTLLVWIVKCMKIQQSAFHNFYCAMHL